MQRLLAAALSLAVLWLPQGAAAQDFASKPIRIIVGWAPGGNVDITARALAPALAEALGTSVVIENKPGAGGTIGTSLVAKAPPDGHTLLLGSTGSVTIAPLVYKSVDFDPIKDLVPVGAIHDAPMILTAAPKTPVSNFAEFLAHAKARGGQLSVASPGTGSTNHLAMGLMMLQADIKLLHVPYKGAGPALNDLVSSQVEMMVDQITPSLPHIREGRIKAIAVTSDKRLKELPDIPTLDEVGLKGFKASTFTGLFGPVGMPEAVLQKLAAAHEKAMQDKTVRDRYLGLGVGILDMKRTDFQAFVKQDYEKWKLVVEKTKITAD